jgi:hypothetical protein
MASAHAKQSPLGKAERSVAADGKVYFSYAQVAETVSSVVPAVKVSGGMTWSAAPACAHMFIHMHPSARMQLTDVRITKSSTH